MKPANAAPLSTDKKFTFSEVADAFFVAYNGRDASLQARIGYWSRELGELPLVDLDEDTVDLHLHRLLKGNALSYRGGASAGGPLQPLHRQRSPATINRYRAALASLIKFARSERLIPKRWESPLKFCNKFAEPQGRLRYLSKSEFESLCKAARVSRYEKLWLYINLALTTGARKGTIESLRWHDIDLENCRATVDRTKNGTPLHVNSNEYHRPRDATLLQTLIVGHYDFSFNNCCKNVDGLITGSKNRFAGAKSLTSNVI